MYNELLDIFEELEMTGLVCFMSLKNKVREELSQLSCHISVDAIDGHVFQMTDRRMIQLSQHADPTLPDGRYNMTPKGVIVVRQAEPELRSDYRATVSEALANGDLSQFDY